MASDAAMARAAQGTDLYAGVVDSGAVATREEAKYAVLGAMYGATTGESSALLYTSAAYSVAVVVTKDTNEGFLANYTVTDTTPQ